MPRTVLNMQGMFPTGPYSQAVVFDDEVYVSGQAPIDPDTGRLVEGDITYQTRQVFTNLFALLRTAGLTEDDVVQVNVYLTDLSELTAMNTVYARQFRAPYPARTIIGVAALQREARIEIDAIARKPCTC